MSGLERRIRRAEKRKPPPPSPPPPPDDPGRRALRETLRPHFPHEVWKLCISGAAAIQADGGLDKLTDEQHAAISMFAALADQIEASGADLLSLNATGRERVAVEAVASLSGDRLYSLLWARTWSSETLPDEDLKAIWGCVPATEDERRAMTRNVAFTLARTRELQLFHGTEPITSQKEAERLVSHLYAPESGTPFQRRRRLEELGEGVRHLPC